MLQPGRAGFGCGTVPKMWSQATKKEREDLVISEAVKMEEECFKIRALNQQQQGRWSSWEAVINRAVMWVDMWRMSQARPRTIPFPVEVRRLEANKASLVTSQWLIQFVG